MRAPDEAMNSRATLPALSTGSAKACRTVTGTRRDTSPAHLAPTDPTLTSENLGSCFNDWTSAGCAGADGASALAAYDIVVADAINTYHLKVVGLVSSEAWHGNQAGWTANSAEQVAKGSGDNAYIRAFAANA